jgi:hypothetical protein
VAERVGTVRWQALFDDLEGQLAALEAAELAAEVRDRSRREAALLSLVDRLGASVGHRVQLHLDHALVRGVLTGTGPDWLLVTEDAGAREALVPVAAVLSVTGVGARTEVPGAGGEVARRLDFRWALRGLARSRSGVAISVRDGSTLTGTLDRVGSDHVDLAEHGAGEARRAGAVRQVRLLPLAAVTVVRSG